MHLRRINYYGPETGDVTPYGQPVEDNRLPEVTDAVLANAEWDRRRAEIDAHNATNPIIRRGLAMMPIKFGISFNLTALNQAGALVHVYQDGSVHLNHGGTEMGQGLFIKVAQVVADVFQIEMDAIKITATATGKVPNTSATAASTGSDLNGMAAFNAAMAIRGRMTKVAADHFGVGEEIITFREGRVHANNESVSFGELAKMTWLKRVQLSEAGFYKTPKIHWDGKTMRGRPFFYFSYGAAVAEVAIDTLTGETRCLRADIVQDVGTPLNPAIDLGQIEGAFRAGHGLAHLRGTVVGQGRPPAHRRAVHLQNPRFPRRAAGVQCVASRPIAEQGRDGLPLQGHRRTAADAGHFRLARHPRRHRFDCRQQVRAGPRSPRDAGACAGVDR